MDQINLLNRLRELKVISLPGKKAQDKMAAYFKEIPSDEWIQLQNPKIGAVMILLIKMEDSIQIVLMKRPDYEGVHSGQISFFGGKKEEVDLTLFHTSIREASEEGGFDTSSLEYLGPLTNLYIQASNYYIEPHVFYSDNMIIFNKDHKEVAGIIQTNFLELIQKKSEEDIHFKNRASFKAPCYRLDQDIIWGATAMMISELEEFIFEN